MLPLIERRSPPTPRAGRVRRLHAAGALAARPSVRRLLREGVRGTAMLAGVVSRLRRPLTPAEARAALDARREHRASAFLRLLRRAVFQAPRSPYAPLLRAARCEYGDIERMVRTDGVEGTLAALFQSGVFLTVSELKGLVPVTRAGAPYWVGRERLRNPMLARSGPGRRSRSPPACGDVPRPRGGAHARHGCRRRPALAPWLLGDPGGRCRGCPAPLCRRRDGTGRLVHASRSARAWDRPRRSLGLARPPAGRRPRGAADAARPLRPARRP